MVLNEFTELRPKYECCTLWGRYYNVKLFAEMLPLKMMSLKMLSLFMCLSK